AFVDVAHDIADERGELALFMLALRSEMTMVMPTSSADPGQRWDVIVSAPWISAGRRMPLGYIFEKIKAHGGRRAMLSVASVRIVPVSDPLVKRVSQAVARRRDLARLLKRGANNGLDWIDPTVLGEGIERAVVVS